MNCSAASEHPAFPSVLDSGGDPALSIVVPLFDEEENVARLCQQTISVLEKLGRTFEFILVNDGSKDGTARVLAALAAADVRIKVVNLRRNYGQTAAMMAGFDVARGQVIVAMDGDLQNDPGDIPVLLAKLDEGFDLVSGWRKDRQDDRLRRILPSRLANRLISFISGVRLHDHGCSLKAYRRDVLEGLRLYGEMHRFMPIYASWQGARVAEIVVHHRRREFGRSKYGLERIVKVILDLIVVKFLGDYSTKPIYLFGMTGVLGISFSFAVFFYATYLKVVNNVSYILTPLPLISIFSFMMGVMFILLGLLAELLVRIYYESQNKPTYRTGSTINIDQDGVRLGSGPRNRPGMADPSPGGASPAPDR
ncbi:MAG: glycosyltransferase family 2 protein [Alphaproteobacteria bacterium]